MGPEYELLAILSTLIFSDNSGKRPLKWLDLRFITVEFSKIFDKSPSMWLSDRSKASTFEVQFQNQLGALLEIPDIDISKNPRDLCDCSHEGKLGPILIEFMETYSSWKGGTQLELTLKKNCVWDIERSFSFDSFLKCPSSIVPVKKLFWIYNSRFERSPRLFGMVPFNWFWLRDNVLIWDKFPTDKGIGPFKELKERSRYVRCLSWPNDSGIFPIRWLGYKDRYSNFSKLKMLGGISPFKELSSR